MLLFRLVGSRLRSTGYYVRQASSAVATLRRFLLLVHPDLIPHAEKRAVNAKNVGVLQAYVREHQYQGAAWLTFHKKGHEEPARVIVGRGVDACVASMATALGEKVQPPPASDAAKVTARWRRRAPVRLRDTLRNYVVPDDVKARRRATARLEFRAGRIAVNHGLSQIESRCGWSARRLCQVFSSLEYALGELNLEGLWGVAISTASTTARLDYDEGMIHVSPSLHVAAWREAIEAAASTLAERRYRAQRLRDNTRAAAAAISMRLGRPVNLGPGKSVDAATFVRWCGQIAAAAPHHAILDTTATSRPTLAIRLEFDRSVSSFAQTSNLAVSPRDDIDGLAVAALAIDDTAVLNVARDRDHALRLAEQCARTLRLASLDLVLAQCPEPLTFPSPENNRPRRLILSGAHKPRGAMLPDLINALNRLLLMAGHDEDPPLATLRSTPVALVAPGTHLAHNHAGVFLLPTDFVSG